MAITSYRVKLFEEIGDSAAVSTDDGDRIHDKIASALQKGLVVEIDFQNINLITSAFLNAAIGQLYGEFTSDKLKEKMKVLNATQDDLRLVKLVTDRAKEYFSEKREGLEESIKKGLEGE